MRFWIDDFLKVNIKKEEITMILEEDIPVSSCIDEITSMTE